MIATFAATIAAMLIVAYRQRIRIFQSVILLWVLGISAVIAALILYIKTLDAKGVQLFSTSLSNGIILLIFLLIILGAVYKHYGIFLRAKKQQVSLVLKGFITICARYNSREYVTWRIQAYSHQFNRLYIICQDLTCQDTA